MSEQPVSPRIEKFIPDDDWRKLAFVCETLFDIGVGHVGACTVAVEWAGDKITRSWWLPIDGRPTPASACSYPPGCPTFKEVSPNIVPGEESKLRDSAVRDKPGLPLQQLSAVQREHQERAADRQRWTLYHDQWHRHLATIAEQASRISRMEADVQQRDGVIAGYRARLAELQAELNESRQQLRTARKQKSWPYRVRLWSRRWKRTD